MRYLKPLSSLAFIALCCCSILEAAQHKQVEQKTTSPQIHQHGYEDLKYFLLPAINFEDLSFEHAVNKLLLEYKATCAETNEKPLDISIKLTDKSTSKRSYVGGGSFNLIVDQLCAIYGMEMKQHEKGFTFSPIPHVKTLQTLNIPVPPDFNTVHSIKKIQTLFNLAHISHSKTRSVLTIRGQDYDVRRCKKFINSFNLITPVQIKIVSKIISVPPDGFPKVWQDGLDNKSLLLSDGQLQMLIRALASNDKVKISTTPSIVTRNKENATIQIIREVIEKNANVNKNKAADQAVKAPAWIGHKLDIKNTMLGLALNTDLSFDYHHVAGMTVADINSFPKAVKKEDIQKFKTSTKLTTKDGMTRVLKIKAPGKANSYLFVTLSIIDATGKRFNNE